MAKRHIRPVYKFSFYISQRMVVTRSFFAKFSARFRIRFSETYSDFAFAAYGICKYPHSSRTLFSEIEYDVTFFIKLSAVGFGKSYLPFLVFKQTERVFRIC